MAVVAAFGMVSCGGPGVCDCVNAEMNDEGKIADEDLAEKCEKMEKEWKDEYKDADDDRKKEMEEEFKECAKDEKKDEE